MLVFMGLWNYSLDFTDYRLTVLRTFDGSFSEVFGRYIPPLGVEGGG